MLNYSDEALAARPAFFAPYNDLTIVVEDVGKERFYTQVMWHLLRGRARIAQVLAMGGKRQVVARFLQRRGASHGRDEFYLVDGDFDDLIGRQLPISGRFYKLDRYDIESFLLEEIAICVIAEEEVPDKSPGEYQVLLDIQEWLSEIVQVVDRLVGCAALLQRWEETEAGISQNIEQYVKGNSTIPNKEIIEEHITRLRTRQTFARPSEFDRLLDEIVDEMGHSGRERLRWISGKDILIPLLGRLLRFHTGRNLPKESLCFRLVKHCAFSELTELRDRIVAAL